MFRAPVRSVTFWKYTEESFNIVADENIMENNYMFVNLWNLGVISHLIFPKCMFLFLAQNLKIT